MSLLKTLLTNTFWLIVSQFGSKILGMALIAFMARALGPDGMGVYSYLLSLIAMFLILPDFGFDVLLIRENSKHSEQREALIGNTLTIKILTTLVSSCLFLGFLTYRHYDSETLTIAAMMLLSANFNSIGATFFAVFRSYEKMEYEAKINLFCSILRSLLGIIAIYAGVKLEGIVICLLLADISAFFYSLNFVLRKFCKISIKVDLGQIKHIVVGSIPFGINSLIAVLIMNTNTLLIGEMAGDSAVGWYSAANKILTTLLIIPAMYMNAVFPVLSRLSVSDEASLKLTYSKSYSYLILLGLPVACVGYLTADDIILSIYGQDFHNSVLVFQILIWVTMFSFVGYINGATLNAIGYERLFVGISSTAAVLNILINYPFIMTFGFIGACYGTLILSIIGFFVFSILCHRLLSIRPEWGILIRGALCSLLTGAGVILLKHLSISVIFILPAAGTLYFILLFGLRCIPRQDIAVFKGVALERLG